MRVSGVDRSVDAALAQGVVDLQDMAADRVAQRQVGNELNDPRRHAMIGGALASCSATTA